MKKLFEKLKPKKKKTIEDGLKEIGIPMRNLKEYTDSELFKCLELNYKMDLTTLGGICSEVLRRMLLKNRNLLE